MTCLVPRQERKEGAPAPQGANLNGGTHFASRRKAVWKGERSTLPAPQHKKERRSREGGRSSGDFTASATTGLSDYMPGAQLSLNFRYTDMFLVMSVAQLVPETYLH